MIISVLNEKGGIGKTTVAIHLAQGLAYRHPTVLLDADPQGTAWDWYHTTDKLNKVKVLQMNTLGTLKIPRGYVHVVIDGAPRVESLMAKSIELSDHVLIPVCASGPDLWASSVTVDMVKTYAKRRGKPQAHLLHNRAHASSVLTRELPTAVQDWGIELMDTILFNRVMYPRALTEGRTVDTLGKPSDPARKEVEKLVEEVLTWH